MKPIFGSPGVSAEALSALAVKPNQTAACPRISSITRKISGRLSISAGNSVPTILISWARTKTVGFAASTTETKICRPSERVISSCRCPVGKTLPETAPVGFKKSRSIRAPGVGTPAIKVVPSTAARLPMTGT
ncbi:unannotated protein [freshwater metagenome]|uniref:Unannotated protein n=1 Tax=freshwater metagenome TaxID=449393 RepID=A0A6J7UZL6_9ZZZZ